MVPGRGSRSNRDLRRVDSAVSDIEPEVRRYGLRTEERTVKALTPSAYFGHRVGREGRPKIGSLREDPNSV